MSAESELRRKVSALTSRVNKLKVRESREVRRFETARKALNRTMVQRRDAEILLESAKEDLKYFKKRRL